MHKKLIYFKELFNFEIHYFNFTTNKELFILKTDLIKKHISLFSISHFKQKASTHNNKLINT